MARLSDNLVNFSPIKTEQNLLSQTRYLHFHKMDLQPQKTLKTGQLLARGMARHLTGLGFVSLEEFPPIKGLRVDLLALGTKSEIWIIECKSSQEDFMSDGKMAELLALV
jgi:hypothetical protein